MNTSPTTGNNVPAASAAIPCEHQMLLSDSPMLKRMRLALTKHLNRVWPTRRVPLCPPAFAGLVYPSDLEIPMLKDHPSSKALVVFLPADYASHLEVLRRQQPRIMIHPDIGMTAQEAYLTWSLPAEPGQLPVTLWIDLPKLAADLEENLVFMGRLVMPIVFVSGQHVVQGEFTLSLADFRNALSLVEQGPANVTPAELARAADKAAKYSERPWRFMRYELKNGNRRYAVNWAQVFSMHPDVGFED